MVKFQYRLGMVKLRYKLELSPSIGLVGAPPKRQQCIMGVNAELWSEHRLRDYI